VIERMNVNNEICPACKRRIFANGGHQHGCSLDASSGLPPQHNGFSDREPLESQRFVSVWDQVTYYTDDREGDRQ
jgi:hypothetical protein